MISSDQLTLIVTILVPMLGAFWTILHKMDQKFDKVDQKFDRVDQRFEKMDHELQDIKTRLTVLETALLVYFWKAH